MCLLQRSNFEYPATLQLQAQRYEADCEQHQLQATDAEDVKPEVELHAMTLTGNTTCLRSDNASAFCRIVMCPDGARLLPTPQPQPRRH